MIAYGELDSKIDSGKQICEQIGLGGENELGLRLLRSDNSSFQARLRALQRIPNLGKRRHENPVNPYADSGCTAQLIHVVALEIIPSVAAIQLLDSPLKGFFANTSPPCTQNPQKPFPVMSVVILLHKLGKTRPVLRKRADYDLALIKLCGIRNQFQQKLLCRGGTLLGQPLVVLVAALGRCPGIDGNAVDMLRAG